jgi:flagellar L-ring protein precursor FlgH
MMPKSIFLVFCPLMACMDTSVVSQPIFTHPQTTIEHSAMMQAEEPLNAFAKPVEMASLWSRGRGSLLGENRAMARGDILTVVIEIDDKAEISNGTNRSRGASQSLGISQLFGIPQRINAELPEGASMDSAVDLNSNSTASGDGSVRRNERLTLRVAATVVDVLPNGVLAIAASQEVRVNFELRDLVVSGYVRPADITRQNEITYDKIASARISYGGRGQITEMQQPRPGQRLIERILPF